MNTYKLTLSEEQVEAVRVALALELDDKSSPFAGNSAMRSAFEEIGKQWHAQHVAQRDAALKEGK